MTYFTLKFRNAAGDLLFETDFTLHELIPLIRHTLRSLAHAPELAESPIGYRAFLRPCYDPLPKRSPAKVSPPEAVALPSPPAIADGSLLQILEEDLDNLAPVSFVDELEAFYNPGTSTLCLSCPERQRCPGSGKATATDLADWIMLDPEALRSNEPVNYFSLRIEALSGRVLYKSEVRLRSLQFFVSLVLILLRESSRPLRPQTLGDRAEIIARFEGQPRVAPILLSATRPRVSLRSNSTIAQPLPEPPRRLVDWDRLEETEPNARPELPRFPTGSLPEPDPVDLEIKVFPTETDPLTHQPPPPSELLPGTQVDPGSLPVFLHRTALHDLTKQRTKVFSEAGGILVGEAFLDPSNGRPYVEVVAALPATDERGDWVKVNLDSHFLRQIQERIDREFPGRRTIGWYSFHLLRVTIRTAGSMVTAGVLGEPLGLLEEEVFLHRNFFPQPWHLGLVIDTVDSFRFYHLRDGTMVITNDWRLVD